MKIISFNLNGIRSAINKDFIGWIKQNDPDILCLQEIKLDTPSLVLNLFEELGYKTYWFPAQKKGYSGVAILTKTTPTAVAYGINIPVFDDEGRIIRVDFDSFSVFSIYFPSGSAGEIRQTIKMKFLEDFFVYIELYKLTNPNFIICGDFNICHQEIDIHNPKANQHNSGFLPEERAWFGKFIDAGYIDTFRYLNPDLKQYSWWSYRSRAKQKNLGWRIDYQIISLPLRDRLKSSYIHSEQNMSDHCPIEICLL